MKIPSFPPLCHNATDFFHGFLRPDIRCPYQENNALYKFKRMVQHEAFNSALYFPPQCERARNVQPISISLLLGSNPKYRDEPIIFWVFRSMTTEAPPDSSDSRKNSLKTPSL